MALNTYDNIIAMGDFNIDVNKDEGIGQDKLDVFCKIFNLTNLVKTENVNANNHKLTIGLILTNKTLFLQFTSDKEVLVIIID